MRIMATLMMSAADPCIGALMALRSANPLTVAFRLLMSGRYLLRLKNVSTYPFSRATSFHVGFHFWERFEIAIDELTGFSALDFQSFSQTEYGDAIDNAEIGSFSFSPLVAGHIFYLFLIDIGSCGGMDIMPFFEGLNHILIVAEMSHDPQFYLAVVSGEEETSIFRNEGFTDFLSVLPSYGDVLQIWIA